MSDPKTLGVEFPKAQARAREVLKQYESIGPAGGFGAATIRQALLRSDEALANADTVAMIRSFKELEGIK